MNTFYSFIHGNRAIENFITNSASWRVAWFITVVCFNHAILHDAESIIAFSTVAVCALSQLAANSFVKAFVAVMGTVGCSLIYFQLFIFPLFDIFIVTFFSAFQTGRKCTQPFIRKMWQCCVFPESERYLQRPRKISRNSPASRSEKIFLRDRLASSRVGNIFWPTRTHCNIIIV